MKGKNDEEVILVWAALFVFSPFFSSMLSFRILFLLPEETICCTNLIFGTIMLQLWNKFLVTLL